VTLDSIRADAAADWEQFCLRQGWVDCPCPLQHVVGAWRPTGAGSAPAIVTVPWAGCAPLPPTEQLDTRTAQLVAPHPTSGSSKKRRTNEYRYIANASQGRVEFTGLRPKTATGRRNKADLEAVHAQSDALRLISARVHEVHALARTEGSVKAWLSWLNTYRQACYEVFHLSPYRWILSKRHLLSPTELAQEEGLQINYAYLVSKRVDSFSSVAQALSHVKTLHELVLRVPFPDFPLLARELVWIELRMAQEVPVRAQRNTLEPKHGVAICNHWLSIIHDSAQHGHIRAFYANVLGAFTAAGTGGYRIKEVAPGPTDFMQYPMWTRKSIGPLTALSEGSACAIEQMRRKTSGRGSRERQERLALPMTYVKKAGSPLNFPAAVDLLFSIDPTDDTAPAFRDTRQGQGPSAPALNSATFRDELRAALEATFPADSQRLVIGDVSVRKMATVCWFMAGASPDEQRALGTWSSSAKFLYDMPTMERTAYLQTMAHACQFTCADNFFLSHSPIISQRQIEAASLCATEARARQGDFSADGDLTSDDDVDVPTRMATSTTTASAAPASTSVAAPAPAAAAQSSTARTTNQCSVCNGIGHNSRTCPDRNAVPANQPTLRQFLK
jgi:hypothetical protein